VLGRFAPLSTWLVVGVAILIFAIAVIGSVLLPSPVVDDGSGFGRINTTAAPGQGAHDVPCPGSEPCGP
jgi:hypothetical protein